MKNRLFEILVFTVTVLLANWFYRDASILFIISIGLIASFIVRFMFHGKYGKHEEKAVFTLIGKRNIEKREFRDYNLFGGELDNVSEGAKEAFEIYKSELLPQLEKSDYNVIHRPAQEDDIKGKCEQIAIENDTHLFRVNVFSNGELQIIHKHKLSGTMMEGLAYKDELDAIRQLMDKVKKVITKEEFTFA